MGKRILSIATAILSFVTWVLAGIVIAAFLSYRLSIEHQDGNDFALTRASVNLVIGGICGFLARFIRFVRSGN